MSRVISYLFLGISAVFLFTACSESTAEAAQQDGIGAKAGAEDAKATGSVQGNEAKTLNVKVVEITPSSLTEFVVAHGVTMAIRDVVYSAELPGRVEFLSANLGGRVRRGQVLARIDFTTVKAQANQAEANHGLAKKTYERLAALEDEDLVSAQKVDEVRSNMISSQAGLDIAKANVKKSTVVATYSGVVAARNVEKGEYVAPGTPLYHVIDYSTIIAEAQIPETQVARLSRGASVDVEISALKQTFEGTVDAIIPAADKVSKTFRLRIKIPNKDMRILVGMSAKVRIATEKKENVIVATYSSIIEEKSGRSVFIAKNGTAEKRRVKLGATEGDKVVIEEGVEFGEQLITVGQRDLSDGQPIRIVP